jgi:hypothetical protein
MGLEGRTKYFGFPCHFALNHLLHIQHSSHPVLYGLSTDRAVKATNLINGMPTMEVLFKGLNRVVLTI